MQKQINSFKRVREYLDSIPNINRGGCGISALAMYRWLKQRGKEKNTKFLLAYTRSDEADYNQNKRSYSGNGEVPTSASHILLYHNRKFFDTDSSYNSMEQLKREYKFFFSHKDEYFLVRSLNDNFSSWNKSFDRIHVFEIEKALKIDLSDVEVENPEDSEDYF